MNNESIIKKTIYHIEEMTSLGSYEISCFWSYECELCEYFMHHNESSILHYYCPWNSKVLYGDKSLSSKYASPECMIKRVKLLPYEEKKKILLEFKKRLECGQYNPETSSLPLISLRQEKIIKDKIEEERLRKEKANEWLDKYLKYYDNNEYIKHLILDNYLKNDFQHNEEGIIFFSPDEMKDVVGAENMSYDEYINIQLQHYSKRFDFIMCYINTPCEFKGKIQKINSKQICFERVYVDGMYLDNAFFFEGKEDHVWMSKNGFEEFQIGDSVSFQAEVYRYLKKSNGKAIEFGLRNPQSIKKIKSYKLPTNKELIKQEVKRIICETCFYYERCNDFYCMRDPKEIKALKKQLTDSILSTQNNKK